MVKQSKIINLAYYMHCGLFCIEFFSLYDSVLLIYDKYISRNVLYFRTGSIFP